MNLIQMLIVFVYGLLLGSFYNVCISRIPKARSIIHPPSHCPKCKNRIHWTMNIPVLSYIFLGGKCHFCHKKISFVYPFVEIITAFFAVFVVYYFKRSDLTDWIIHSSVYFLFISGLIISSFIDIRFLIIPDRFTIGGVFIGVLLSTLFPQLHGYQMHKEGFIYSIMSALICFGVLNTVRLIGSWVYKREAMGFGDIKLVAAFGAFLGWKFGLLSIFFGALLGSVVGIISILLSNLKMQSEIPFGPYLALGAVISLFWGEAFLKMYLNFSLFL